MTKKEFLVNAILAFCLSLVSLLYAAEDTLFGIMRNNIVQRGFPFHFMESMVGQNFFSSKVLMFWALADFVFYLGVCFSIGFVVKSWFYERNKKPVIFSVILTATFFLLSNSISDACVTGFPVEFYLRCSGGNIGLDYIVLGYTFNPLFWLCISAIVVSFIYWLKSRQVIRALLLHKNIFWMIFGAWLVFFVIAVLGLIFSNDRVDGELFSYIAGAVIGFLALKKLRVFYKVDYGGRAIFFTKMGYLIMGLGIGVVLITIVFNIFYVGGWFDFTDAGFELISLPLRDFLGFKPDNNVLSARLILYGICAVNIVLVSYTVDISSLIVKKTFLFVKDQFKKTQV